MNNNGFLSVLKTAYRDYLNSHRRSNAKLKTLHGKIAEDLQTRLGTDYNVMALGFGDEREASISGRYMDKRVDISVFRDGQELGGVAIKFIMTNYSQNSNNYFESMLGETANIRSANKSYFQIIILPEKLPYFDKDDVISKIEVITGNNLGKYIKLSQDNVSDFMHTPNKTLLYLVKTTDFSSATNRESFKELMLGNLQITLSNKTISVGDALIYNNYNRFIDKVAHAFMAM